MSHPHDGCPRCCLEAREEEAAHGDRCAQCHKPLREAWPVEDPDHPGFCRPCGSVQHTKGAVAGRYGAGRNAS